ncbi:hypothetical protein F2P81_005555 [Scophthalmus maximus]|uniref:Uncharacterized protein n=1 Tax=Scophthalmus maximus TaxID=52904 RepID=A0A6A4T7J9_SCOMX|nr:hypothetical protein F2P81_005555 [Scophthalmus maximus]
MQLGKKTRKGGCGMIKLLADRDLKPGIMQSLSPHHSVFPARSFVRHPHHWLGEREVCRQRQDTPFVSQQRTCLAEIRFQSRCQTKSHLVQELQDKLCEEHEQHDGAIKTFRPNKIRV